MKKEKKIEEVIKNPFCPITRCMMDMIAHSKNAYPTLWLFRDPERRYARNKTGWLWLTDTKPKREGHGFVTSGRTLAINEDCYPEVTFENSPRKVKVILQEVSCDSSEE